MGVKEFRPTSAGRRFMSGLTYDEKGAMKPMPNLMETELESFGAVKIEDFTWKQLFDTDACTVCGRCT